jgi:hypothetical protein
MILERITTKQGPLEELLKKAKTGDQIVLLEGQFDSYEMPYNERVFYHRSLGCVYRNDEKIAEEIITAWDIISGRLVAEDADKTIIRDVAEKDKILFQGTYQWWIRTADSKLLVMKDQELFLNLRVAGSTLGHILWGLSSSKKALLF